jgi:hypothetical protein
MRKKPSTTIGKILLLMHRIHIRPIYILIPAALSFATAFFEGIGIGLLIPILNGFLTKSFSFVTKVPVLGTIFAQLPPSLLQNDKLLFGLLLGGFMIFYTLKNIIRCLCTLSVTYFSERTVHHLRKDTCISGNSSSTAQVSDIIPPCFSIFRDRRSFLCSPSTAS